MVERLAVSVDQYRLARRDRFAIVYCHAGPIIFCWVSVGWSLNHSSYVLPLEVGLRHH
jgi:hypothetical protein